MARPIMQTRGGGMLPWLGLALVLLIVDQFTKILILGSYQLGDSTRVTSFFNLVRVHNEGAAFSFLAGAAGWQRWFFTAIGIGAALFIVWMLRSHAGQRLFAFAMACILGAPSATSSTGWFTATWWIFYSSTTPVGISPLSMWPTARLPSELSP